MGARKGRAWLALIALGLMPGMARADRQPGPPPPQRILYIGDDCGFGDDVVVAALECLGHVVTPVCVTDAGFTDELAAAGLVPADFDQLWDNRFSGRRSAPSSDTLDAADQALLDAYLRQGGSVFLAGENDAFHSRNDGLLAFLGGLVSTAGPLGPVGTDCGADTAAVLNPAPSVLAGAQDFGSDPVPVVDHSLTIHCAGGLRISTGGIGSGRPVLVNGTGSALAPLQDYADALAFTGCGDIQPQRSMGKVFVFMDSVVTSWQGLGTVACPPRDLSLFALLANIADFLAPDPFLISPDSDADLVKDACDNCPLTPNGPAQDAQADADGDGAGDACDRCAGFDDALDRDGDLVPDACDNCADLLNDQADADSDAVGDACDNCPLAPNGPAQDAQADTDGDGAGDACDRCAGFDDRVDRDGDLVPDACDNCPDLPNAQADADSDAVGDACDNCRLAPNGPAQDAQADADGDGAGDACDRCAGFDDRIDRDGDLVPDACDNCPDIPNAQADADSDAVGDACDNCPLAPNGPTQDAQMDTDADGTGDACDLCPGFDDRLDRDRDLVPDACDNCPDVANGPGEDDQADADADAIGDACDACPGWDDRIDTDADGRPDGCDACPLDPFNDADEDGICGDVDNCPAEPNPGQEDGDSNGRGDACECGDVHQVPPDYGPGSSLRVHAGATLSWDAVPDASHYPVYRGTIPAVGGMASRPAPYDHRCFSHPVRTTVSDASSPPTGCWYYLVNAANSCGGAPESVGTDSLGRPRPAPPCP